MLSKYFSGDLTAAELLQFDPDAANIRDIGSSPTTADLRLLVEWFSNPGVTSDFPFPIGSDRQRNPTR
jgi:hypothetical protein